MDAKEALEALKDAESRKEELRIQYGDQIVRVFKLRMAAGLCTLCGGTGRWMDDLCECQKKQAETVRD